MSVNRYDYIVLGWKLPYEMGNFNWLDDKFLPYVEGRPGVEYSIIPDEMTHKYVVFGKVISHATDWGGFGFQYLDILNNTYETENLLMEKYRELFCNGEDVIISQPYLFVFSHFS